MAPIPTGPSLCRAQSIAVVRMPRSGGPEELLLDGPALAEGKAYFAFGEHQNSPDHRLYAYTADETGSENYNLRIRDIGSGRDLPEVIADVTSFAWSKASDTLFYVKRDEDHRPRFVYRHRLGTDPEVIPRSTRRTISASRSPSAAPGPSGSW